MPLRARRRLKLGALRILLAFLLAAVAALRPWRM